jgi:Bax protein
LTTISAFLPQPATGARFRRAISRLVGLCLVLAAIGVWGAVLYASLTGVVDARQSGAEAIAASARRDALELLAQRAAENRGQAQARSARAAALAAEESGRSPDGSQLAEALGEAESPAARKEAFIKIVLPLILTENARIASERTRLLALAAQVRQQQNLSESNAVWLRAIAADYEISDDASLGDMLDSLMGKVDIIPPSMALGQAAEESGWGGSHPAQGQNALFGLQTMAIGGLLSAPVPARDGRLKNASFEHLRQCVTAYMHTLNTKRAYNEFRTARAERRKAGRLPEGPALVVHLTRYSELGMDYVRKIQSLIRRNRLDALDRLPQDAAGG